MTSDHLSFSNRKVLIIIDTNKLRNNFEWEKDFSEVEFKGDLIRIINWIEENKLQGFVKIGIPEIVLSEVVVTRAENFEKQCSQLTDSVSKLKNLMSTDYPECDLPNKEEYIQFINNKINEYLITKDYISILKLDKNKFAEIMTIILRKALFKEKPLDKSTNFKDALIWEIILNIENPDEFYSIFYLCENTKDFDGNLQNEFNHKFLKELNLEVNTNLLIESLENIYDLYIEYKTTINYLKTDYFNSILKQSILDQNIDLDVNDLKVKDILNIQDINISDLEQLDLDLVEDHNNIKRIDMLLVGSKVSTVQIYFDIISNEILYLIL